MIYLLAKYALVFILATIVGFFLGRWMTRRKFVDVTERYEELRSASVNERLDGLVYALAQLPEAPTTDRAPVAGKSGAVGNVVSELPKPADVSTLERASFGKKDDLKRISGVGPKLEQLLNSNGIFYFWQIANWTDTDIESIDDRLDTFKGRIGRDSWVSQADRFHREPGSAQQPTEMRISA